ncbi:MAG: tRNA pseudouridine(55) synthase TruB [Oscillospiraceae bacterium]|nr:tRNA pseudouridine(55) synthase TruB [Oscillospiraceae bacterium]
MNGILCVNKPEGFTSFDVVAKMRGITGVRKMGHAGTLDPMATGVLPLLLGRATKACDLLPDETKRYTAGFRFGLSTDTQDITGKVLTSSEEPVAREALLSALPAFRGELQQLPPMYSAVQVNGQRLYDLARQGREVEREPRTVRIGELSLLEYEAESRTGILDIRCSKGTYVRTLIHDLGRQLGAGGVLTSLVRTESSGFSLEGCITIEEAARLSEGGTLQEKLIPIEAVFRGCPSVGLSAVQKRMFLNGVRLDLNRVRYRPGKGLHAVYGPEREFLGVARLDLEAMELRVVSFF